jgi:DNA-binding LacI/PurR family transcriptional regulator
MSVHTMPVKKSAPLKKKSFKELAKVANVSPAIVSRVAKGQVNVDPAIRARVRKTAEMLGIDLDHKRNEKANVIAFNVGEPGSAA